MNTQHEYSCHFVMLSQDEIAKQFRAIFAEPVANDLEWGTFPVSDGEVQRLTALGHKCTCRPRE